MSEASAFAVGASTWNVYRYAGDYLHDAAVVVLILQLWCKRTVAGLSRRSQFLYLLVFVSRYLDLLENTSSAYLVAHKLFFIGTTLLALLPFQIWKSTYEGHRDTCPSWWIAAASMLLSPFVANEGSQLEVMWTFSQILEGFAMVPQYVLSYRNDSESDIDEGWGIRIYIVAMGFYRFCYMLNWAHKKSMANDYWDPHSWVGGAVNLSLFADYLLFKVVGVSCLRRLTLSLDDGVRQVGQDLKERLGGCLLSQGSGHGPDVVFAELPRLGRPGERPMTPAATFGAPVDMEQPAE
mmetsp:Transcript_56724/g.184611  ORF Transcript_56724/g.184611 Transcript_56724/m.184611 type:complete len:294 (-) Transcript_56724:142-1023(-)|eukprot:CAMPEP_0204197608 /NCGR_PEP_ID=MMETSP0361-20130328/64693_1 /ASSEMBLY_ACC=CAM_ASM_000343 /TAXON_ID=268821 /ORGANISM="Scrippsiella Hangoei, Strain SHTV-5" /LENGTH=293 /DNA_ID=CAMNT_0051159583 /DNA_START=47 /DNA_END=928 /DNA_ORIENTATION=+